MRCLGRLAGLGIVLIFLLVYPCSLWTFNTQRVMLSGENYKTTFKNDDFYRDLIPAVLPALLQDLEHNHPAAENAVTLLRLIEHLEPQEWEKIAPALVPLEWVEYSVNTNLDIFFDWLDGDGSLSIKFPTEALRRRLSGSQGVTSVQMIAQALPACSAAEEARLVAYTDAAANSAFPYCWPSESSLQTDVLGIVNNARQQAAAELPAELDVLAEMRAAEHDASMGADPFSDAELDRFRAGVRLWKRLAPLTLMVPLVLLSLVIIFAVRSSKLFFRWMGWPLLVGCLFALAPLFLLPFVTPELDVEAEVEGGFGVGGTLIAQVVGSRMVELMLGQLTWPMLTQAAILLVMSFIFIVISVLLPDPDAPPDPELLALPSAAATANPPDTHRTSHRL